MNQPTHPSAEQLGAYLDGQLTEAECTALEQQISQDPELKALLEDFTLLQDLGPAVDDRLPGDGYWQDLPDRVLARIATEDAAEGRTPVGEAPERGGFWQRLFAPQAAWSWAGATAVVGVIGAFALFRPGAAPADLAEAPAESAAPTFASNLDPRPETDTVPTEYVRRVARTYGSENDIGTVLDVDPRLVDRQILNAGGADGSILQVGGFGYLDVPEPREPRALLEDDGCDVNEAFMAARYCDESGARDLAREGYGLVRDNTPPESALHLAAKLGFTRAEWRERVAAQNAGNTLVQLGSAADRAYQQHAAGNHVDCEDAWVLHFTLLDVGRDHLDQDQARVVATRMTALEDCVNR